MITTKSAVRKSAIALVYLISMMAAAQEFSGHFVGPGELAYQNADDQGYFKAHNVEYVIEHTTEVFWVKTCAYSYSEGIKSCRPLKLAITAQGKLMLDGKKVGRIKPNRVNVDFNDTDGTRVQMAMGFNEDETLSVSHVDVSNSALLSLHAKMEKQ